MQKISELKDTELVIEQSTKSDINIQNCNHVDVNIKDNDYLDVNIDKCKHLTLRVIQPLSQFEVVLNGVKYTLSEDGTTLVKD